MKKENIETLISFMKENDLSKISYSDGDLSISLEKPSMIEPNQLSQLLSSQSFVSQKETQVSTAPKASTSSEPCSSTTLTEIVSPLVGTFYTNPSPDKPAFVKVGDQVEAGQTLCIIEAMKILNPVHATLSGTIKKICCENESPVEFNQALFEIDPD